MRTGGVTARSDQTNEERVDGRSERADTGPQATNLQMRVAVQSEHSTHVTQGSVFDQRERAAGSHLLSRLEQQPDCTRQPPRIGQAGQDLRCADQSRGVHVMSAGMGHTRMG